MDSAESSINPLRPVAPAADGDGPSQVDSLVAPVIHKHEATCWGCGSLLILSSYSPIFKCGWCGAITNKNAIRRDNNGYWWRRLRDKCFVSVLIFFMLFLIGGGVWAVLPIVFSISKFCGVLHCSIAATLSVTTICSFSQAAFRSAGAPPLIIWGNYTVVGKGGLENYTFCRYCSRPKSPRTHHCRACRMCVLDMDHHCPFIGNCVGASNHRSFVIFLISAILGMLYLSGMSVYAGYHIWPPLRYRAIYLLRGNNNSSLAWRVVKETVLAFMSSAVFLSARGLVLVYLFVASVSVQIGLVVLLWQQLCYIYEGNTYLGHLSSQEGGDAVGERDCQNFVRFFGFPATTQLWHLPRFRCPKKKHTK